MFTFWDYFRNHRRTNSGLLIDYLLLSAPLKSTLMEANVDTWVRGRPHASDHAPAWIQLRDAGIARLVKTIGRRAATKDEGRARSAKAKTRRGIRKK